MAKEETFLTFIGAGNVAWHLAPAWDNTAFQVKEVFSRNPEDSRLLVRRLYNASVADTLDFSKSPSKIFLLTLPDDALEEVVRKIVLPGDAILVHCSGSQRIQLLEKAGASGTGVCYPLQTFTTGKSIDTQAIPFFIESSDKATEQLLTRMVKAISPKLYVATSQTRFGIHLAAVFASNFTNHMLAISSELVNRYQLDFSLLRPLIVETLNKSLDIGPTNAQTGPARRGDVEILDKHVEILEDDPPVQEIYRIVSQHILDKYHS